MTPLLILVCAIAFLSFLLVLGARVFRRFRAAVTYSYALYEFARSMQIFSNQVESVGLFDREKAASQYPGWTGPLLNRHVHLRDLLTPEDRAVTTPNNDTLYTSAVVELSGGPVEIVAPDSTERYLSIAFMDMFNDQVASIGTRGTQGQGGTYWLVGPEQNVEVPPGVQRLDFQCNDLWLLARVFVAGKDDLEAAREFQGKISVCPVKTDDKGRVFDTKVTSVKDAENFITVVNEILGRSPLLGHSKRAMAHKGLGIEPGALDAFGKLPAWKRAFWSLVTSRLEDQIFAQADARMRHQVGWVTPPPNLGNYGEDDDIRTGVAMLGFGALTTEEAIYFRANKDAQGIPLDGRKAYRMVLPAQGVPVKAFWSLSMYERDENNRLFFYENELDRYAINSSSDALTRQPNGEIILALQPEPPADPSIVWMPTPDGPFETFFRAYLPEPSLQSGDWTIPALTRIH